MQRVGSQPLCSPLDLAGFIACEHLTQLELAVAVGGCRRPNFEDAYADLIRCKGEEHEQAYLEGLRAAGHAVTQVGLGAGRDFESAARVTAAAIEGWATRRGATG